MFFWKRTEKMIFQLQGIASWVETVVITAIIMGLCFYFYPQDPIFLHNTFPWIWFAPVLITLRYDAFHGVVSIILIALMSFYLKEGELVSVLSTGYYFLGGFLLTALCGMFQAYWRERNENAMELEKYLNERLTTLTNAYHAMRLSHDRLEQNFVSLPLTTVGAMKKLRVVLAESGGELNKNSAENLINLLNPFCALQAAAIYQYKDGKFDMEPIAHLGKKIPLAEDDILVKKCLENKVTSYYAVNELTEYQQSQYIVASLLQSDNGILGIFVVQDMGFWNLTDATIQTINLMLTYFTDDLVAAKQAKDLLKLYPDIPLAFAKELYRVVDLKKKLNIPSAIITFIIPKSSQRNIVVAHLVYQHNDLTLTWQHKQGNEEREIVLLPLFTPKMVEDYLQRTKQDLKQNMGIVLGEKEVYARYIELTAETPEQNVNKILSLQA